jgi:hypothetical protein
MREKIDETSMCATVCDHNGCFRLMVGLSVSYIYCISNVMSKESKSIPPSQSQKEICTLIAQFGENQKRVCITMNVDDGTLCGSIAEIHGKVKVAGNTKSKIFRDDLPGGRTCVVFILHEFIVNVSPVADSISPLFDATKQNNAEKVRRILMNSKSKEKVNQTDPRYGWSSLHWACYNGSVDIVRDLLCQHGIDVNKFANVCY